MHGSSRPSSLTAPVAAGAPAASGVKAGYSIEYTTTTVHNRVLIENPGDGKGSSAAFDIGDFQLLVKNTDSALISNVFFEDDGPSFAVDLTAVPTLTTDDTDIPDTAGPTNFDVLFTPDYGEDGFLDADDNNVADAGALTYALGVKSAGVDSGLVDTLTGDAVLLNKVGNDIVGKAGAAGTEVFRIALDTDTGAVTLTQSRAVVHNDPFDPVESGGSAAALTSADLVTLTATITDGDYDTASNTRDIGLAFKFEDDGPSFAVDPMEIDWLHLLAPAGDWQLSLFIIRCSETGNCAFIAHAEPDVTSWSRAIFATQAPTGYMSMLQAQAPTLFSSYVERF